MVTSAFCMKYCEKKKLTYCKIGYKNIKILKKKILKNITRKGNNRKNNEELCIKFMVNYIILVLRNEMVEFITLFFYINVLRLPTLTLYI